VTPTPTARPAVGLSHPVSRVRLGEPPHVLVELRGVLEAIPRACLGLVIFAVPRTRLPAAALGPLNARSAVWIVPWLLGLVAIGYFGRCGSPNAIPNWWDLLLVAILAIAFYEVAEKLAVNA